MRTLIADHGVVHGAVADSFDADGQADQLVDAVRRSELAAFLRARRSELQPEDVGIPRWARRRVSGLRREEVAELAWMSVTWYTWLEQGRDIRTTPQVLDALASALRLDEANHRYLRRLGGFPLAGTPASAGSDISQEMLRGLVEDQLPAPAMLIRPNADIVAWNAAAKRLWADPAAFPAERRNGLFMIVDEEIRTKLVDWEAHCRRAIACFRAESGKRLGDRRDRELVSMLMETSSLFRKVWPEHQVQRGVSVPYTTRNAQVGEIRTEPVALRPVGGGAYLMIVHRLTDPESRERMVELLAA